MTTVLPKTIASNLGNFSGRAWLLPVLLDWLENSDERLFILTGEPGSGKSMVSAWLADHNAPLLSEPDDRQRLERLRFEVKAAHFCLAASGNTSPKALAQSLAGQLQERIPVFDQALAGTLKEYLQILNQQNIGSISPGASVIGTQIENLNLGGMGDELSFDRILREPLIELYRTYAYAGSLLIIVDSLDEAMTYTGELTIPRLLTKLADLPPQVRFLVTTRPDPRILKNFPTARKFDLIEDAPADQDDVLNYAKKRLKVEADGQRTGLAERIGKASEGNFLYAHLVLQDLLPRLSEIQDLERIPLPQGLAGVYQDFLNRELGADEQRWHEAFRPVLGLIAVGQGDGLIQEQIGRFAGLDVTPVLRACKQFLDGELPGGPFRPFHRSFVDFLFDKETNQDYFIDKTEMHRKIVDDYRDRLPAWRAIDWGQVDDYGIMHLPTHLLIMLEEPQPKERAGLLRSWRAMYDSYQRFLLAMLTNLKYLEKKAHLVGMHAAQFDLYRARHFIRGSWSGLRLYLAEQRLILSRFNNLEIWPLPDEPELDSFEGVWVPFKGAGSMAGPETFATFIKGQFLVRRQAVVTASPQAALEAFRRHLERQKWETEWSESGRPLRFRHDWPSIGRGWVQVIASPLLDGRTSLALTNVLAPDPRGWWGISQTLATTSWFMPSLGVFRFLGPFLFFFMASFIGVSELDFATQIQELTGSSQEASQAANRRRRVFSLGLLIFFVYVALEIFGFVALISAHNLFRPLLVVGLPVWLLAFAANLGLLRSARRFAALPGRWAPGAALLDLEARFGGLVLVFLFVMLLIEYFG